MSADANNEAATEHLWACPQCNEKNSNSTQQCVTCQYPDVLREELWSKVRNVGAGNEGEGAGGSAGFVDQTMEVSSVCWDCLWCTMKNKKKLRWCVVCGKMRGSRPPQASATSAGDASRFGPQYFVDVETPIDVIETPPESPAVRSMLERMMSTPLPAHARQLRGCIPTKLVSGDTRDQGCFFAFWWPKDGEHIACVAGDFSDWTAVQLNYDEEMSVWWAEIVYCQPGATYKFVLVNRTTAAYTWRCDPYALQTVRPRWNHVAYDHSAFMWTDTAWQTPAWNSVVIYELHVASFAETKKGKGDGTFDGVIQHLDHLTELGVNCVELMPVHEDLHHSCWGYDPLSLFSIHGPLGGPDAFKRLVNACHRAGIAVIVDWVPNHMSSKCVLRDADGPSPGPSGVWFYRDATTRDTDYGPRLDLSAHEVRRYVIQSALTLLREFRCDGLRVDSTETLRRHKSGVDLTEAWTLMQELNDRVRHTFGDGRKFMIAEDLQNNVLMNHSCAGFDSQWDAGFFSRVYHAMQTPSDHDRSIESLRTAMTEHFQHGVENRIIYTESHDTVPTDRQQRLPAAIAPTSSDSFFAVRRTQLAAVLLFTGVGIPMMLQGQEVCETHAPAWELKNGCVHGPAVDWTRIKSRGGMVCLFKHLIALRRNAYGNTRGLTGSHIRVTHANHGQWATNTSAPCPHRVMVIHRWERGGAQDDVMVLINLSNRQYEAYTFGVPRPGSWFVRFNLSWSGYDATYEDGPGGGFRVETTNKPYDGFPFSARIELDRYSAILLSQDRLHV